jgi:hypothetical protein
MILGFPVKSGDFWTLPVKQLQAWSELYPSLNVQAEIQKALAWVQANPQRRKTARGMPRFLVGWLNHATPSVWKQQAGPRFEYEQWRMAGGCPHTPRCPHFSACQLVSGRRTGAEGPAQ